MVMDHLVVKVVWWYGPERRSISLRFVGVALRLLAASKALPVSTIRCIKSNFGDIIIRSFKACQRTGDTMRNILTHKCIIIVEGKGFIQIPLVTYSDRDP